MKLYVSQQNVYISMRHVKLFFIEKKCVNNQNWTFLRTYYRYIRIELKHLSQTSRFEEFHFQLSIFYTVLPALCTQRYALSHLCLDKPKRDLISHHLYPEGMY